MSDYFRLTRKPPGPWHLVDHMVREAVLFARCGINQDLGNVERTGESVKPLCCNCRRAYSPWKRRLDAIADREP